MDWVLHLNVDLAQTESCDQLQKQVNVAAKADRAGCVVMEDGQHEWIQQATDLLGPDADRYARVLSASDQFFEEHSIAS